MSFSCVHANDVSNVYIVAEKNFPFAIETSPDAYLNNFFKNFTISTNPAWDFSATSNLKSLLVSYCASVLINNTNHVNPDSTFLFSSRQSAFVYLLCKNLHPDSSLFFTGRIENFATYFKESDFAKLDLPVKNDQQHLAYLYADDLFNSIIKEYFTIKQADVYGLQTDDAAKKSIEDQVNIFSAAYFKDINICKKSDPLWKYFPKTCTYMTQYLRNQRRMFKDLNILSSSGIYTDYVKIIKETPDACSDLNKKDSYTIILCGLWWNPNEKNFSPFVNLIYNELFYYNLFVEYYALQVTKYPNLFYDEATMAGVWSISAQQASYIGQMRSELFFSRQALKTSIRMLRNAYVTFPIHIWFLMYRESLQDFGLALAKIATPVYTLFGDKFKNVQCLPQ